MDLEESLQQLGLSPSETAVYLSVVRLGKTLPSRVAKDTGIKRSTVYGLIKSLVEKRLVEEDLGGKTTYVIARPLEALDDLLTEDKRQLKRKQKALDHSISELEQLSHSGSYSPPRIRFVEERDMFDYMKKRIKDWQDDSIKYDVTWWGFQDYSIIDKYEDWIDKSWKVAPKGWQLKMVSNHAPIEKKKAKQYGGRRHMKYWNHATDFTSTVAVSGDYILMWMTRERPHYMIELYDKVLAHNLREYFRNTWNILD